MKRKQVVQDKLDSLDNQLVAIWQAVQTTGITKERIEIYLQNIRATVHDINNLITLED